MIPPFTSFWLAASPAHFFKNVLRFSAVSLRLLLLVGIIFNATAGSARGIAEASYPGDSTIAATICANETYSFDGQSLSASGNYTAVFTATDGTDSTVTLQLLVLPVSADTLYVSICQGQSYLFSGQTLLEPGRYQEVLVGVNGCDSTVTLNLTVLAPSQTNLTAGICRGSSYLFQGDTLSESGLYVSTLTAANGCDSLVWLDLQVVNFFDIQQTQAICAGDSIQFGGAVLDTAGVYVQSLIASGGCDSIITLTLTVLPHSSSNLNASICLGSQYLYQGDTLTESGIYTYTLTAVNGCDSLVHLDLSVVEYYDVQQSAVICAGEGYPFGGAIIQTTGVYVDSLLAQGGCDSISTLTLTVLPVSGTSISVTLCDGLTYIFEGDTLSNSGLYVHTYVAENGCDSLVSVQLAFVPYFETALQAVICNGDSYLFGGQQLMQAGVYTDTLTAVGGCDSVLTLTLSYFPVTNGTDGATICAGESFLYQGEELTEAGPHDYLLENSNGCDSLVTFTLTVLPTQNTVLGAVICAGETYVFQGDTLESQGVYESVLQGVNGCDSTVNLVLIVLPEVTTALMATVCAGETYEFNGDTLEQSGAYTMNLFTTTGCDSTVTLTLNVLTAQTTTIEGVICAGDSYEFAGVVRTETGTYTAILTDANGCDSTVTLYLEVLPLQQTNVEATICEGASYPFNGAAPSVAGVYTATLPGSNGCDSVVTLTLTVLPTQKTEIDATICEGNVYGYDGQILASSGTYSFGLMGVNGCDSTVTIHLTVLPIQHTAIVASACVGTAYEYNGQLFSETGVYDIVFQGSNGCDSVVTLNLLVRPSVITILDVTECQGREYVFNGTTLDTSGTYVANLSNIYGCDSTVILSLVFVDILTSTFEASICAGGTYTFGAETLTESGEYTQTFEAIGGCDSLVTLSLVVLPLSSGSLSASICAGSSYPFNGAFLSDPGMYTATLTSSNGCDSTVVLSLSVLPTSGSVINATICSNETYGFAGAALSETGVYSNILQSSNGCDSTVTLNLLVLPVVSTLVTGTICAGEYYEFGDTLLNVAGTYSEIFSAENGCDSVVTLVLNVVPVAQGYVEAIEYCGRPYDFNGVSLTESGLYSVVLEHAAASGCDSVATLSLTLLPAVPLTIEFGFICTGESYPFNGMTFTNPGTYSFSTTSVNGCDSVIALVLTVGTLDVSVTSDNGVLTASSTSPFSTFEWVDCANNQFLANGSQFTPTVSGSYAVIATDTIGCMALSSCVTVVISDVSELLGASGWALQPNPAVESTTIVLQEALQQDISLEIFDVSGRLLYRQTVATGTNQVNLDISTFPDGILLVRLSSSEGVSSKRMMKGH
jgi:hypothetical protein